MKSIIYLIVFLSISISAISQTYNKKYSEDIEEINEYLLVNEYSDAFQILRKLEKSGYDNANISYKLGLCYLNSVHEKAKAVSYLEKASKHISLNYDNSNTLEKEAPNTALLYLGDAYRVNNQLTDAVRTYKQYLALVKDNSKDRDIAEKRILEGQLAQLFIKRPINVHFDKLNTSINEGMGNFNACISGDGKSLVFNRKMKFYDAIFFCTRTDSGWTVPKEITIQLGSDGEFQPTGLSHDGKRMLLASYNHLSGYDIYQSIFKDGKWRKVKILGNSVNSAFHEVDAVYGPDNKSIYFSSNRVSGLGGFDLYKAVIDDAGNIGQAENLGSPVNSEWDEKSPSFTSNGAILVFSSQRRPGIGGFDFFYCKQTAQGKWGTVYNVGYPLSTVGDDLGFSTVLPNNEGVIPKHSQDEASDEDIFNVRFDVLSKFKLVPLSGVVQLRDGDNPSYKGLSLYFIDEVIKDTVGKVEDPEGGKYKIDLYPGEFKIVMSKEKNKTVSQAFTIPSDELKTDYQLVSEFKPDSETISTTTTASISENKVKPDTLYVKDILFEFNQSSLSQINKEEVEKFVHSLRNYKISRIELVGFTDCFGSKEYNKRLSEKRALVVMNLFIKNGVSKEIITYRGMGDSIAAAKNKNADGSDNPDGRAYNRRVEIVINSNDTNLVIIRKDMVPGYLKP
jgi:outer membrane protein OmpA-like peptidoglycan-associated protein